LQQELKNGMKIAGRLYHFRNRQKERILFCYENCFGGCPIGLMMVRWAQQFGLLPHNFDAGNPNLQPHFQDPELTLTLLLTWAHAWAVYEGANNAQAVHTTHVAPHMGFFPLGGGHGGGLAVRVLLRLGACLVGVAVILETIATLIKVRRLPLAPRISVPSR